MLIDAILKDEVLYPAVQWSWAMMAEPVFATLVGIGVGAVIGAIVGLVTR